MMQLAQVAMAVGGQLHGSDVSVRGIVTDTREDCLDQLFVALKGDNFDAHEFVEVAQSKNAAGALLERDLKGLQIPRVVVESSHQALKDLAAWWRAQFVIPVVAITGSVGKTSVKEMLGGIFALLGEGVVTRGNLNNEIGVPLTLMRLQETDQFAIVEMGMNHAGEIARLTQIAKPTIALINNAAAAHLEGLGSVAAVAQAKGEIFEGLAVDGVAILNLDDEHADLWRDLAKQYRVVTFGLSKEADVSATYQLDTSGITLQVNALGELFTIEMPVLGLHNVRNALAACAVSIAANIPAELIRAGLQSYRPIGGRMTIAKFPELTLLDDTYNANPASMRAAVDTLCQFDRSTLIVGDMGELGEITQRAHRELGQYAAEKGVQHLYACGEFAGLVAEGYGKSAQSFKQQSDLLEFLAEHPSLQGAVLVKGSRFAQMENVVKFLSKQQEQQVGGRV